MVKPKKVVVFSDPARLHLFVEKKGITSLIACLIVKYPSASLLLATNRGVPLKPVHLLTVLL